MIGAEIIVWGGFWAICGGAILAPLWALVVLAWNERGNEVGRYDA